MIFSKHFIVLSEIRGKTGGGGVGQRGEMSPVLDGQFQILEKGLIWMLGSLNRIVGDEYFTHFNHEINKYIKLVTICSPSIALSLRGQSHLREWQLTSGCFGNRHFS